MECNLETAVLIQTHNNAKYICTLALKNPKVRFYVHVDKKKPLVFEEIKKNNIVNINLIDERVNVYWGGSTQLTATLKLMNEAIKNNKNKFFHLISGECLPLKSFEEIEKEWKQNPKLNYIESNKNSEYDWRLKTIYPHANTDYLRTLLGKVLTKILKLSSNILKLTNIDKNNYYFGSQWFSITRSTIEKIIFISNSSNFFLDFKYTTCADEHAFQILVRKYNVEYITNNNKRLINFAGNSSPIYLSKKTLIDEINKNNYWFARKVKENVAIDLLKNT